MQSYKFLPQKSSLYDRPVKNHVQADEVHNLDSLKSNTIQSLFNLKGKNISNIATDCRTEDGIKYLVNTKSFHLRLSNVSIIYK